MNSFLNRPQESHSSHLVCKFGGRLCWLARYQTSARPVNRSETYRIFSLACYNRVAFAQMCYRPFIRIPLTLRKHHRNWDGTEGFGVPS